MIIILKENTTPQELNNLTDFIKSHGLTPHISEGVHQTIMGLVGDTSQIDIESISQLKIVEAVRRIQEPFKNANRKFLEVWKIHEQRGFETGAIGWIILCCEQTKVKAENKAYWKSLVYLKRIVF